MDRNSITKLSRDAAEALEHSSSLLTTRPPQQPSAECAPDRRTFGGVIYKVSLISVSHVVIASVPLISVVNQSSCFRNNCEVSCFNFIVSNISVGESYF